MKASSKDGQVMNKSAKPRKLERWLSRLIREFDQARLMKMKNNESS